MYVLSNVQGLSTIVVLRGQSLWQGLCSSVLLSVSILYDDTEHTQMKLTKDTVAVRIQDLQQQILTHEECVSVLLTVILPPLPPAHTHSLSHRQYLAPCEAEVIVSGYDRVRSTASNNWSGLTIQRTNHVFIGGLPLRSRLYQVSITSVGDIQYLYWMWTMDPEYFPMKPVSIMYWSHIYDAL